MFSNFSNFKNFPQISFPKNLFYHTLQLFINFLQTFQTILFPKFSNSLNFTQNFNKMSHFKKNEILFLNFLNLLIFQLPQTLNYQKLFLLYLKILYLKKDTHN